MTGAQEVAAALTEVSCPADAAFAPPSATPQNILTAAERGHFRSLRA
ncbi:hypothetical protein [Parafrigoribacterium mesophilum]